MMNKSVQMWFLTIQRYNEEIKYIKGSSIDNILSRLPGSNGDKEPQGLSAAEEETILGVSDMSYEVGL